jgi:hypothetical protein
LYRSSFIEKIIIPRKKPTDMPNVHSKPESRETAATRRTYDEPLPIIPQTEKGSIQKPKDIKVSLRQDPAVEDSPKIVKVFTEFVGNSPEAYCQWRCDMDEYVTGTGIIAVPALMQASTQLLSQIHRTTWDNIVLQVVPVGLVVNEEQVEEIYNAFALTFMGPTARRKQKRYMASGSIQKPKSWSSKQMAI